MTVADDGGEMMEKKQETVPRRPSIFILSIILPSQPNGPSTINATIGIKQNKTGIARKQSNCAPSHDRRPVGTIYSHTSCAVDSALDTTKSSLLPVAEIGMRSNIRPCASIFVSPWALEACKKGKDAAEANLRSRQRTITQKAGREVRICKVLNLGSRDTSAETI
jgi:hypothetical protein